MNLVGYTATALSRNDIEDTPTNKNVVDFAIVELKDLQGNLVTIYDDADGANPEKQKTCDTNGQVTFFAEVGDYILEINGKSQRINLSSASAGDQLTTTQLITQSIKLDIGGTIRTNGFHVAGDGGGALWVKTADTDTTSLNVYKSGDLYFVTDSLGSVWVKKSTGVTKARAIGFKSITKDNESEYKNLGVDNYAISNLITNSSIDWQGGLYPFSGSVELGDDYLHIGIGKPHLAPFPQTGDDKEFLRDGYRHQMPGCGWLFTDSATSTKTTNRSDQFSSFSYAVRVGDGASSNFKGIAIIQDMLFRNSGGTLTTPSTDERSGYNVGLLIDDAPNCEFDVCVFGYWDVAGTCVLSQGIGGNPDYNKFFGGSTMGDYGLALIAYDTSAGDGEGLSGTQGFGFQLYGNDHHSRQPQTVGTHEYGHCLLVDGKTAGVTDNINGHYFFGGGWRTYSNAPIILDNCSNLYASGVPLEFPEGVGRPSQIGTKFYATSNTSQIHLNGLRNFRNTYVDHDDFNKVIESYIYTGDDNFHSLTCGSLGNNVKMQSKSSDGVPQIQFTDKLNSSTDGFTIKKYADSLLVKKDNVKVFKIDSSGITETLRSINSESFQEIDASGAIALSSGYMRVTVDTTADLLTISGGVAGEVIRMRPNTTGDSFTIKSTGGNIRMDSDVLLPNSQSVYELIFNGAFWVPVQSGINT